MSTIAQQIDRRRRDAPGFIRIDALLFRTSLSLIRAIVSRLDTPTCSRKPTPSEAVMIPTVDPRSAARFILAACVLAACDGADSHRAADSPGFTTRDSAGVSIAENASVAPTGLATWGVDTAASMTIGVSDGDSAYELGRIGAVRRLPNGMIVVLTGQGEAAASELRFYDSTGKHIGTHGRYGQGPGDFRWINFFGPAGGDTVVAVDFPNSRVNWVSASTGYVRSTRLDDARFKAILGEDASGAVEGMMPLGDSLYAVKVFRMKPGVGSPFERGTTFHIVDLRANTASDLVGYDAPPRKPVQLSTGPTTVGPLDAGNPLHVIDGARRRLCAAITTITQIACIDARGQRLIIRWTAETVPYTDDDRAAYETSFRRMRGGPRGSSEADIRTLLAAIDRPERHNPFSALQIDTEGNFWVLEYTLDATGTRQSRFRVFDAEGRHIAFADPFPIPRVGFGSVVHIDERATVRAFEDANGVPMVGVFRIRKKPDAS
jgi:hypothetical protein